MFLRPTESKAPLQEFVEEGSAQDFKRCVLAHIDYCRTLSIAFWGTYAPGTNYEYGAEVLLKGTDTWLRIDDPLIRPNEAHNYQTMLHPAFSSTGTVTGGWHEERLQIGSDGVARNTDIHYHCDREVWPHSEASPAYSAP